MDLICDEYIRVHRQQEVQMHPDPAPDRRVHVHIHVPEYVRRALRLAAAHRGTTIGALVSYWAVAEARSLGLLVGGDGGGR